MSKDPISDITRPEMITKLTKFVMLLSFLGDQAENVGEFKRRSDSMARETYRKRGWQGQQARLRSPVQF